VGLAAAAVFGFESAVPTVVTGQASPAVVQPGSTGRAPWGGWGSGDGTSGNAQPASTGTATTAQEVGVVDIDTVLQYQQAEAAGTGMILTSNGEVLTNNHVVDGATKITVTVVSTGASYTATVVGTDPTDDVAVLQLQHASGLQTVSIRSAAAKVGESVTAVGNAGGAGGTPSAATGTVTALNRSITASDENGANPEQISGLIETNADVQAGDSGGPLYDSSGKVIGMDTAASSGPVADAYAIPISTATAIADKIESGVDNATIHQGYPAFLGVSVQDGDGGAAVADVVSGSAADDAGIVAGDVITAVGGQAVSSADSLSSAMAALSAGQHATVTWTDSSGAAHSATVTLGTGPAD
jgi:S1-C subfamily serine protease